MTYANYLMHHGRKGQKWGVRNGPPYPLDGQGLKRFEANKKVAEVGRPSHKKEIKNADGSTTYPKGFIFNRYGQAKLDVNRTGGLYVTNGIDDAARYMEEFGGTKLSSLFNSFKRQHVQHIKATEDLKVPSREQLAKMTAEYLLDFQSTYEKPKWYQFKKQVEEQSTWRVPPSLEEKDLKAVIDNPGSEQAEHLVWRVSNPLGVSPEYAKGYYNWIKKSGYDAIMDYNDIDSGLGRTPMIILNTGKIKQYDVTFLNRDLIKVGKKYAGKLEGIAPKRWG